MKPRKPLQEMAGHEPVQIAGKPAGVCPYCGCAMLVDGVTRSEREIMRYLECRNNRCGRRFVSYQPVAKLVREIAGDNSVDGKPTLTFLRKVC